jgi:hypothetical protein
VIREGLEMNALEVVHGLERAGFSRQQAEAISEAVEKATLGPSARLATRDDVDGARAETTSLRMELKEEIAALRTELKEEIAAVRAELHKEIGGLASKAAALLLARRRSSSPSPSFSPDPRCARRSGAPV